MIFKYFQVTCKLSGCSSDLRDEAELYLGLIPLTGFTNGGYIHPLKDSLPDGPIPDPVEIVQPSENPYLNENNQFVPSLKSDFTSNMATYPTHPNTYPAQPNTYPTHQTVYPSPINGNNSRPSSGSYGFVVEPTPPSYGNSNVTYPGAVRPSAPPPYP